MDIQDKTNPISVGGRAALRIGAAELRKLLVEWNQTATEFPRGLCIHQLFEAQVERSPSATAVEFEGLRLTYRELNNQANQLASRLRQIGVGPEVLVGICVEPCLEMLVGLLGILKAGGAYVPMDPAYPTDRLAFILADTAMPVLLTLERLRPVLPKNQILVLDLDEELRDAAFEMAPNPTSSVTPKNLAYIIYTSGSTGQPKGVMIPHRGLVNYLTWAVKAYRVADGTGAPVLSSISFDLTITGLFAPLIVGRCVHVTSGNPGRMERNKMAMRNEPFSLVKITPAHLKLMREQESQDALYSRTRAFVIGGEALYGEDLAFWQKQMPQAMLVNEYGPTETVVGCCVFIVPKGEHLSGRVPIGRPIANTQVYVLDPDLQPVPLGATGELYIGGEGVARGYLNRPELTRASFISNPFFENDPKASAIVYKTGDLVRYRTDGNLEFLGRIDDQIKIRGYRVEPGEIEAVLSSHPGVLASKVTARADSPERHSLVAYLVARHPPGPSIAELRDFLKQRLPGYMIPAAYVTLPKLPLTPNGKVDRRALPPPQSQSLASGSYVLPRTEIEHVITEIWETLFQFEPIGVCDDFFDIGGDSLMGLQLITEINRVFDARLDVADFLEASTIEGLSQSLLNKDMSFKRPKLVRLRKGRSGQSIIFLNAPMDVLPLSRLMETPHSIYTDRIPFRPEVIQAAVQNNWKVLPTIADLAADHTLLIKNAGLAESCILAGWSSEGVVAFEVAHQLNRDGIRVEAVLLFDSDIHAAGWARFKRWVELLSNQGRSLGWYHASRIARERLQKEWRKRASGLTSVKPTPAPTPTEECSVSGVPWTIIFSIWLNAHNDYPRRRLASRGVLIRAQESIYNRRHDFDGCLGWRGLFKHGLQIFTVPGEHVSMWKEPHLIKLAETCSISLAQARRAAGAR